MAASVYKMLKTTVVREFHQMSRSSKISAVLLLNSFSGATIGSSYGIWTNNTNVENSYYSEGGDMFQWGVFGVFLGLPVLLPITADLFTREDRRTHDSMRNLRKDIQYCKKVLEEKKGNA